MTTFSKTENCDEFLKYLKKRNLGDYVNEAELSLIRSLAEIWANTE